MALNALMFKNGYKAPTRRHNRLVRVDFHGAKDVPTGKAMLFLKLRG